MSKINRNHIEAAMARHGIIFFLVAVLMAFGLYSLPKMNKNEFP